MQFLYFCHYFLTPNTLELWLTIALLCPTSISKEGTHSPIWNKLTIEVWEICIQHLSHLSAAHIPGKHNVIAELHVNFRILLNGWFPDIFDRLCSVFVTDRFASRLNKQLEHYASWLPDPGCCIIDAMSVLRHSQYVYIFPPFSMI